MAKATSTLLDHILTNANELVSNFGVLDIGLSDHQLVFCTRKKKFKHKTIKTRSLKKYTAENFCNKLNDVNFANYSEFDDVNNVFVHFSDKLMQAVDGIAPYREFRVKGHTEDWFDGEIMERIKNRDKLLNKYKKSKLEVDHQIYREAKFIASSLIKSKK